MLEINEFADFLDGMKVRSERITEILAYRSAAFAALAVFEMETSHAAANAFPKPSESVAEILLILDAACAKLEDSDSPVWPEIAFLINPGPGSADYYGIRATEKPAPPSAAPPSARQLLERIEHKLDHLTMVVIDGNAAA